MDVGVEGVGEPGARQAVLVRPMVELVVEVGVAGLHAVLHHRLTDPLQLLLPTALAPDGQRQASPQLFRVQEVHRFSL